MLLNWRKNLRHFSENLGKLQPPILKFHPKKSFARKVPHVPLVGSNRFYGSHIVEQVGRCHVGLLAGFANSDVKIWLGIISNNKPLSLSLSHTHTHAHTHTLSLSLSSNLVTIGITEKDTGTTNGNLFFSFFSLFTILSKCQSGRTWTFDLGQCSTTVLYLTIVSSKMASTIIS